MKRLNRISLVAALTLVICLALGLMGLTMILTGLAQDFRTAFFLRLLTGLGHGSSYVPAMALGSAWFAMKRRGFATGIVSAGIGAHLYGKYRCGRAFFDDREELTASAVVELAAPPTSREP